VAAAPVGVIKDAPKAGVLLKPLRREILAHARRPVSAAGIAALVVATSPIWMALFEAVVAGERPSRLTVAGLVAGTTGVAILVVPLEGIPPIDPLGLGLVAGAGMTDSDNTRSSAQAWYGPIVVD